MPEVTPHQCPLGSVARYPIDADVRLHTPLTHRNDRYGGVAYPITFDDASLSINSLDAELCLCFDGYPHDLDWEVYKQVSKVYVTIKELVASTFVTDIVTEAAAAAAAANVDAGVDAGVEATRAQEEKGDCGAIMYEATDVLREVEDVDPQACNALCLTEKEGLCIGYAHTPTSGSQLRKCILFRKNGGSCASPEFDNIQLNSGIHKSIVHRQEWEPCISPSLEMWFNRVAGKTNATALNAASSSSSGVDYTPGNAAYFNGTGNSLDTNLTLLVSLAADGSIDNAELNSDIINKVFQASSGIVQIECTGCTSKPHQLYYYRRYTHIAAFDFYRDVLETWASAGSEMHVDFDFFSTLEDASAAVNPWTYCNYDDPGIGLPRDCGPSGFVGSQWLSMSRAYSNPRKFAFKVVGGLNVRRQMYTMSRKVEVIKQATAACRTECECATPLDFVANAKHDVSTKKYDTGKSHSKRERGDGWCNMHDGSLFQEIDCDGDTLPDPVCTNQSFALGVKGSIYPGETDTWPNGTCTTYQENPRDACWSCTDDEDDGKRGCCADCIETATGAPTLTTDGATTCGLFQYVVVESYSFRDAEGAAERAQIPFPFGDEFDGEAGTCGALVINKMSCKRALAIKRVYTFEGVLLALTGIFFILGYHHRIKQVEQMIDRGLLQAMDNEAYEGLRIGEAVPHDLYLRCISVLEKQAVEIAESRALGTGTDSMHLSDESAV